MLELFKGSGNLPDDLEAFKEYLGDRYSANKLVRTKNNDYIYIVQENEKGCMESYAGRLYVLGKEGIIGLLSYEVFLNASVVIIKEMHYKDPVYYNTGIGTALLKFIEEYSLKNNIKLIRGILSPYDIENYKSIIMHFYAKYDYNIDFYHGEVKKIIGNEK